MSQESNSQTSSEWFSSHMLSSQSSFSLQTLDDNALAFEPEIIRAKSGERLWVVANTHECITICKSQLLVSSPFLPLIRRINLQGSRLVSRRCRLRPTGRNSQIVSMQRQASPMLSANIARPRSLTRVLHERKTPPARRATLKIARNTNSKNTNVAIAKDY